MACKRCHATLEIPQSPDEQVERQEELPNEEDSEEQTSSGHKPVEIEYTDTQAPEAESTVGTDDDPPLPRRKKAWAVSGLGLWIVGVLTLLLILSLVAASWKVNRARELSSKQEVTKTGKDKSNIPSGNPSINRPAAEGRGPENVGSEDTNSAAWGAGLVCFGGIFIVFGAVAGIVWLVVSYVDVCPRCGRWKAVVQVGCRIVKQKKCFGIVVRRGHSTSRGAVFAGKQGTLPTVSHSESEWEERVPVVRTTYKITHACRYCRARWSEREVEEVEDFEPDEPLPPRDE